MPTPRDRAITILRRTFGDTLHPSDVETIFDLASAPRYAKLAPIFLDFAQALSESGAPTTLPRHTDMRLGKPCR
jgi:hypothetical protein